MQPWTLPRKAPEADWTRHLKAEDTIVLVHRSRAPTTSSVVDWIASLWSYAIPLRHHGRGEELHCSQATAPMGKNTDVNGEHHHSPRISGKRAMRKGSTPRDYCPRHTQGRVEREGVSTLLYRVPPRRSWERRGGSGCIFLMARKLNIYK